MRGLGTSIASVQVRTAGFPHRWGRGGVGRGRAPAGGSLGVPGPRASNVQPALPHALPFCPSPRVVHSHTFRVADPPRAGQARPMVPVAASRRARVGLPAAGPPGGGSNRCNKRCTSAIQMLFRCAVTVAAGPRWVMAGGSAALGLAGHLVGAWGAAGRGSAGVFEVHTPFPRPSGLDQRRHSR